MRGGTYSPPLLKVHPYVDTDTTTTKGNSWSDFQISDILLNMLYEEVFRKLDDKKDIADIEALEALEQMGDKDE
jgi:hypothetical protein